MPFTLAQKLAYYRKLAKSKRTYRSKRTFFKGKGKYSLARSRYSTFTGRGAYGLPGSYLGKTSLYAVKDKAQTAPVSYTSLGSGGKNFPLPPNGPRTKGGYYNSTFYKLGSKWLPKGSLAAIGGGLGSIIGPSGSALGALAGTGLSKLLGFGEYKIKSNTLSEGTSPARMHGTNSNLRVRHREYITDIISSATANTFKLQSFPINPGLIQTYPWLAPIAQQYEEYVPRGIVFEFKTLSSTAIANAANITMGGIIMATDYNAINPPFVNKQQMDNTEYTCSAPVYSSFYHPVECAKGNNPQNVYYIRSGAPPAGTDIRVYDQGLFQIASFGLQGTSVVLGELWVTYEYELRKPISTNAIGQDVLSDHYNISSASNVFPLGQVPLLQPNSSIGGTITGGAGQQSYNFPATYQEGTFIFIYNVRGTATVITNPVIAVVNCTLLQIWVNDTVSVNAGSFNGTTTAVSALMFVVQITGLGAAVSFSGQVLPVPITGGDLIVTQFDSNIVT